MNQSMIWENDKQGIYIYKGVSFDLVMFMYVLQPPTKNEEEIVIDWLLADASIKLPFLQQTEHTSCLSK